MSLLSSPVPAAPPASGVPATNREALDHLRDTTLAQRYQAVRMLSAQPVAAPRAPTPPSGGPRQP